MLMMVLFVAPSLASAAGIIQIVPKDCITDSSGNPQKGGCQSICDLAELAQNILNDAIYISVFLSAVLFAWSGWMHMTAGGDMNKIKEANKVFSAVFIGLIIIISAWLIVDTLIRTLTGNPAGAPWSQICKDK